jgi:hypothetical protein
MKNVMMILILAGCASDPRSSGAAETATTDSGGCRLGEQPVFGDDGELVCSAVPEWPPPRTGSRAAPAGCELRDGAYAGLAWTTDHEAKVRPAFSVTNVLTIAGGAMVLERQGSTLEPQAYNLDWVDAGSANVWVDGDTDTWEFVVWRDCATGAVRGSRTLNLPYYNPGHQVETWTFELAAPVTR